jgi:hypothetical protein
MKKVKAKDIKNLNTNGIKIEGCTTYKGVTDWYNTMPKHQWSVGSVSPPRRETKYENKRNCSY